jgi:hypothetical protein
MRDHIPEQLEKARIRQGDYGSDSSFGTTGAFMINGPCYMDLRILSSGAWDNLDWEHVSVSLKNRCPNWQEMCFVKDLFWNEDEVVMQLHPAKKDYVNHHEYCLHLWRPTKVEIPLPPRIMVGPKASAA